jgi:hypothetical protein
VGVEQYQRIVDAKQHGTRAFLSSGLLTNASTTTGFSGSGSGSGVSEASTSDPLDHPGLLSLRMDPPLLHVQVRLLSLNY